MTSQLEYWATIGKAAEENPDLPCSFIKETLLAIEEMNEREKEALDDGVLEISRNPTAGEEKRAI